MTKSFIQVAVNVPLRAGVFDYSLPEDLPGKVGIGSLVIVPFGKQTVQGVVLRYVDQPSVPQTKNVLQLVDLDPALSQIQIALAEWMSKATLSPLAEIIDLFLPPGLSQHADSLFEIQSNGSIHYPLAQKISPVADRILKLLRSRGPLRGRQIDRHFNRINWRHSAQMLVHQGLLESRPVLPPARIRPKFIRTAQLAVAPETAQAALPSLGQKSTLARRQKALELLIQKPEPVNISWIYAESGCKLADLQVLEERELIALRETEIWRDPIGRADLSGLSGGNVPELTGEQKKAWDEIESGFQRLAGGERVRPFLLDGVTGSGKTELYIRAAREAVRRGKQAIVLVPEISLTPQTVRRFLDHFPGQVGLIHSQLSDGERYDTWRRARTGSLKVVIGARSALFTPVPNPGLIVLDECHDGSYYQSEPPFYHTATTAQVYARLAGALCLLGSATPSIQQQFQAEHGQSNRLELSKRISNSQVGSIEGGLPPVEIVDMRNELKAGNRGIFSMQLQEELRGTLERGEQAILFLNRRGTSTYVFCRNCGYVAKCPRCESPMTLHLTDRAKLRCHHCGYFRNVPDVCPVCESRSIRAFGLGCEKVESEVGGLFPRARTLRWDWETTRRKDAHEIILTHFAAGRADILVGTQMLAKGLDLPLVTLVGIVLAEVGLNLPDPFAAERVFQVLTHVAGRAGRSERGGRVILQTFQPDHYAIHAAAHHDTHGFYRLELAERERLGYPPFSRLVRCEYRHFDPAKAEKEARSFAAKIKDLIANREGVQSAIVGPVPCFYAKLNGQYRWQIVLRGNEPESLLKDHIPAGWRIEVDPASLL